MNELIKSIKNALKNNNWYAALFIALCIPDICGKLENPKEVPKDRYTKWFSNNVGTKYIKGVGPNNNKHIFLCANDCYALRCSYFHEGSSDITNQSAREKLNNFVFKSPNKMGRHCNYFVNSEGKKLLQLQVDHFCEDLCEAAEKWLEKHKNNSVIQERISKLIKIQ